MPSCYHKQMDERNIRWLGIVDYSRRTPQGRITNGHNEILYDARRMYASVAAIDTNPLQIQNKETVKVPSVAELPLSYAIVATPRCRHPRRLERIHSSHLMPPHVIMRGVHHAALVRCGA